MQSWRCVRFNDLAARACAFACARVQSHPFFLRTVPSDAAQGQALADFVVDLKQTKWCVRARFLFTDVTVEKKKISFLLHTEDLYGFGIAEVFRSVALTKNITIVGTQTLPTDASATDRIDQVMKTLAAAIYGVNFDKKQVLGDLGTILYLGSSSELYGVVLQRAEQLKLIGAPFIWLSSDGSTSWDFTADSNFKLQREESRLGVFAVTVFGPTSKKYKDTMLAAWQARAKLVRLFVCLFVFLFVCLF